MYVADVGNMRRLLEANNYSIYVPFISLITCLFVNNSQEITAMETFKTIILSNEEVI
jgi:hypothetical protein